ncbi:MAG: polysaccharide deacetylase family protein [Clostridia bacterium]|nr:polysaccharide deacetylase family protein [Clostridia bacterium]
MLLLALAVACAATLGPPRLGRPDGAGPALPPASEVASSVPAGPPAEPTEGAAGAGPAAGSELPGALGTPVPILMYHEIGTPRGPWPELYVRPEDFAAQMAFLRDHGFRAITLAELLDAWAGRRALPAHPVVVTFDDGYASTVTRALPVLRRNGAHATLFLQTGLLGKPGALTPEMVREWLSAGDELGDHTATHPDLRTLDDARLTREIAGSKADLEATFGVRVRTFAYPSGDYDRRAVAEVRRAGFEAAVTTAYGLARPADLYELRRVRISGSDRLSGFERKLRALLGPIPAAPNASDARPR